MPNYHVIVIAKLLRGERQGETQLVDRLSQLEGVERSTQAQGDTWSQELRVRQSSQTRVSDFGLDERGGVQLVLGGEFHVDGGRLDRVPGGLSTSFHERRNLVVVRSGEHRQVGGGGGSHVVKRVSVTDTDRVLVDGGVVDVVTQFGTGGETVVSHSQVSGGNWALQQVEEQTSIDLILLVEKVQFSVSGAIGDHRGHQFSLKSGSQQLRQLNLGVQGIGIVPRLSQSQAGGLVSVFGFDGSGDGIGGVGLSLNGKTDAIWSHSLHINGCGSQVEEVTGQQVVGRLLDVRECWWCHLLLYDLWGGAGAGVFIVGGRPPGNAHEAGVGVCGEKNSRSDCGFHWSELILRFGVPRWMEVACAIIFSLFQLCFSRFAPHSRWPVGEPFCRIRRYTIRREPSPLFGL